MEAGEIETWVHQHYHEGEWHAASIVLNEKRGVWKLHDGRMCYALKHLHTPTEFPVLLQAELSLGRISPPVVRTRGRQLCFWHNGQCFFLSRWIEGTVATDAYRYIRAASLFHRQARRMPPIAGPVYGPLSKDRWLGIYEKKLAKLEEWMKGRVGPEKAAYANCIRIGTEALACLKKLDLHIYIEEAAEQGTIAHYDLHRGNVLLAGDAMCVLDFDSACISLQVCDLHQIISDALEKMALLPEQVPALLNIYFAEYPEARRFQDIYRAVSRFPHFFWTIAERAALLNDPEATVVRLIEAAEVERKKDDYLRE